MAAAPERHGRAAGATRHPLRPASDRTCRADLKRARSPACGALRRSPRRQRRCELMADVSLAEARAAAQRIAGRVHLTPCWESRTFSELCGTRVWLKYENLQRTGSYKIRGALNRILTLPPGQRDRGVV